MRRIGVLIPMALLWVGCSSGRSMPGQTVFGSWGGEHMRLVAGDSTVSMEFDCAHAWVEGTITTDAKGRFSVTGTYVMESGAYREGDPLRKHAVRFRGQVLGGAMSVSVTEELTGSSLGTYQLALGGEAVIFKCQ